jgi:GDP-mannose transporter
VLLLWGFRFLNLIKFRELDKDEARKWLPIAAALVGMIYTGSKSLQYLRIPIYTIFKNLTIILIAYGEVLWFGGNVTHLMLVSFGLMVSVFFVFVFYILLNAFEGIFFGDCWLGGYS